MDNLELDFNLLVQETLTEAINSEEAKEFRREFLFADSVAEDFKAPDIAKGPEGPGILFEIHKDTFSFSIDVYPVEDLGTIWKGLSIEEKEIISFFEVPSLEVANYIVEQVKHKRFSSQEMNLFNISDPCASWWLKDDGNSFTLHFSVQSSDEDNVYELGPLGDSGLALQILSKSAEQLGKWFTINEIEVSRRKVTVSTFRDENGNYENGFGQLKDLFLNGEESTIPFDKDVISSNPSFYFYLNEIAYMRKFWLLVERLKKSID